MLLFSLFSRSNLHHHLSRASALLCFPFVLSSFFAVSQREEEYDTADCSEVQSNDLIPVSDHDMLFTKSAALSIHPLDFALKVNIQIFPAERQREGAGERQSQRLRIQREQRQLQLPRFTILPTVVEEVESLAEQFEKKQRDRPSLRDIEHVDEAEQLNEDLIDDEENPTQASEARKQEADASVQLIRAKTAAEIAAQEEEEDDMKE